MTTRIIDLICSDLAIFSQNFWINQTTGGSGRGLDGRHQVLYSENRFWAGRVDLPAYMGGDIRKAQVFGDQLRGRINVLRIHVRNIGTPVFRGDVAAFLTSVGVSAAVQAHGHQDYSDDTHFTDGTGFALPDYADPVVTVAGTVGATTLVIDGYLGRNLAVGAFFSHNDFLYRVEENDDGRIKFNPPLRQAIAASDLVEVSDPKIRVRLADDAGWEPFSEAFRRTSAMNISVQEVFER